MKNLKVRQRQSAIVAALRRHGSLSVAALSDLLHVSQETIRRDAVPMENNGEIVKLHGALTLPHDISEPDFEKRMRESAPAKLAIARAAVQHIRDGDSLIIDTGTTTTFFARELRQRRNLTVITNSTEIARTLADVPGNRVYLAGGEMESGSGASFGATANDFVSRFQVRHVVLSIAALDLSAGPMDTQLMEADFARAAIGRSSHRIILADSSKFGQAAFARVCSYDDIELIVTEQPPAAEFFAVLAASGTKLVVAVDDANQNSR